MPKPQLANAVRMTDCSAYGGKVAMHIGDGAAVEADGFTAAGFERTGIENKGVFRGRRIRIR
jgi:hypothetical protein